MTTPNLIEADLVRAAAAVSQPASRVRLVEMPNYDKWNYRILFIYL